MISQNCGISGLGILNGRLSSVHILSHTSLYIECTLIVNDLISHAFIQVRFAEKTKYFIVGNKHFYQLLQQTS